MSEEQKTLTRYFNGSKELSGNDMYYLSLNYGTHILDDYKQVEYSLCCDAVLDTRTRWKRLIDICSTCGKDV